MKVVYMHFWIKDISGPPQVKCIKPAVCVCHCLTCIFTPWQTPGCLGLDALLFCLAALTTYNLPRSISIAFRVFSTYPPSPPPPRLPIALPPHFTRPSTHPTLALCSGLSAGWCDICHLDERRGTNPYPISDLFPPLPLWRH